MQILLEFVTELSFSRNSLNVEYLPLTLEHQPHKMIKHTQTIRRQFADELFECIWSFCDVGA